MDTNIKLYFDGHPKKDAFYFTTDGQAFYEEAGASAHAQNLERKTKGAGKINKVTRADVNGWWAKEAPRLAQAAELRVAECEKEEVAAQAVVSALTKSATPTQRMKANGRLKAATEELAKANAELEQAVAAAEKLQPVADKEAINEAVAAAEKQLAEDQEAGKDATVLDADEAAVAKAKK